MRLTDEENTAESGIDIVASPPGKKLQNVLLLSGGEKALTALSLLFAPARMGVRLVMGAVEIPAAIFHVLRRKEA